MRFLADEHLPASSIHALRAAGHDGVHGHGCGTTVFVPELLVRPALSYPAKA